MKIPNFFVAAAIALAAWTASGHAARADSMLYDDASVIETQASFVESFTINTPGVLTLTVSGMPWLDSVTNVTSFLTSSTGTVGKAMAATGSESFDIGPGTYYAHWFGDAQGIYGAGVLGVQVKFQPTVVPLPASVTLMLSGLGLMVGLGFWRGPDPR
jgi:hypothetical protein